MHILVVSLNYKSTPVEIREKFTFQDDLDRAAKTLRNYKSILECVVLSTCNRTEIYVVADQLHTGRYYTKLFLSDWFQIPMDEFANYLVIKENEQAVEHLFRVTCGLDSMVLGETQILGQVRDAFTVAQKENTTGKIFNQLFKQAITVAKRAHSETTIGENAVSVSYAAVELGKKIFGRFQNKRVLVLGAGKMSELTAKNLTSNGVNEITVINRTKERAMELAEKFNGVAKGIDEIENELLTADILISSTGSRGYVLTKDIVEKIVKKRNGSPLFFIDIAVPRDIDPQISEMDDVYLYDIDDLQDIVTANLEERKKEAEKIEWMIEEEMAEFQQWLNTLEVVPVISALRNKAMNIQSETMKSLERKLPHLSDREKKVIRKHMKSIINQMLRDPILTVKELPEEEYGEELLHFITKLFAIEEEVQDEKNHSSVNIQMNKTERKFTINKEKEKQHFQSEVFVRSL